VKWYGQYGRKVSWIVKIYERKASRILIRYADNIEERQVK
jgi:hypothetical protein